MNKALERLAVELKLPLIPTLIILAVIPLIWNPTVHAFVYNQIPCLIKSMQGKSTPVVLTLVALIVYLFSAHLYNAFRKNPQLHCPSCGQYTFEPLPVEGKGLPFNINRIQSEKRCSSCGYCATVSHNKPIK